ncbi:hypothetical protein GCK32_022632 [Trichostrongylus colubriformis]|uniref:Secreted protein n=1 Tax=Trichostrongylus colubriformis TaxID=6319 RepID=A0AAN8IJB9_TRICO
MASIHFLGVSFSVLQMFSITSPVIDDGLTCHLPIASVKHRGNTKDCLKLIRVMVYWVGAHSSQR